MKTNVSAMLSQEGTVEKATSAYLDDIYISEDISPTSHIRAKLAQFGLDCKDPERFEDRARVLDLDIRREKGNLAMEMGECSSGHS